jgi:effector-binding domain-containing protein
MKKTNVILTLLFFLFASTALAVLPLSPAQSQEIQLKEVSPFPYCCIVHKGPYTHIGDIIQKLMFTIRSRNIFPTGPMIGVFHNSPAVVKPDDLEWEIGFPVDAAVNISEPLKKKVWNFTTVVSAIPRGAYEDTGKTIAKMAEWMEKMGLIQAGPVLQRYLVNPTPDTKPEDLTSEIWIPYQKK